MGSVEFLLALKAIDLLRRQDFLQPSIEVGLIAHRPVRGLHLTACAVAGNLAHTEVDVGMPLLMGNAHDLFQARSADRLLPLRRRC